MKKGRLEIRINPQEKLFLMESSKRLGYTNISDFMMDLFRGNIELTYPKKVETEEDLVDLFRSEYPVTLFDEIETGKQLDITQCLPFSFMKTDNHFYIFCPIGFYPVIFRYNAIKEKLQYKIVKDFVTLEELLTLLTKTKDSWAKEEADYLHNYYGYLYATENSI